MKKSTWSVCDGCRETPQWIGQASRPYHPGTLQPHTPEVTVGEPLRLEPLCLRVTPTHNTSSHLRGARNGAGSRCSLGPTTAFNVGHGIFSPTRHPLISLQHACSLSPSPSLSPPPLVRLRPSHHTRRPLFPRSVAGCGLSPRQPSPTLGWRLKARGSNRH